MITLNSIDRKLDTFKQTLDTISIKQDQYHFIRHQSNFTEPIRLPTDSNLRYNTPPFPQHRPNFPNSPILPINRNSRTAYQPLCNRRDLLNFPNLIHKPINYIYSHPRQQNQHTAPQSHYINNRILHHMIINKLTSKMTSPISNLSLLSKIFERTIATHIIKHITTNSLDTPMRSAYKPYHNTETLLLNLTNYISNNIKNNCFVILILLELTAFDTINHQILFAKLQSIGIHNTIIQLIKSFLTGSTFNIRSNKLSILDPLLFKIYISNIDLIMNCYNTKYHMYANDTQIYTSTTFNELPNTLKVINSITTKLENYFNYNYLKFNLQKTEYIIFHSKSHTPPPITHIKIANKDIPIKTTITTLGVIFESNLTFDKNISSITK